MPGNGNAQSFESLATSNQNINDHPQLSDKLTDYIAEIHNGTTDPSEEVLAAILALDPSDPEAQAALGDLVEALQDTGHILAITSDGGGPEAQLTLDENTLAVTAVQADDPQDGPVTYNIEGGTDAALFTIDPTTGALSFVAAPDYESPADFGGDNDYEVLVRATDLVSGQTDIQVLTVTVADVNEAPEIAPGGDDFGWVDEDSEDAPTIVSGQLTANDPDVGTVLSWSVVEGGIGSYGTMTIDENGQWTYVLDNDSEAVQAFTQTDSLTETFEVQVQDEFGLLDTQTVTITVTGSDDGLVMENFWVGTDARDTFSGYLGNTSIIGNGGNDYLMGDARQAFIYDGYLSAYFDDPLTGNDNLRGRVPLDEARAGHDIIDGGGGNDIIIGDANVDLKTITRYGVTLDSFWSTGNDFLYGGSGNDRVYGDGNVTAGFRVHGSLTGIEFGDDFVDGGDGQDILYGEGFLAYANSGYASGGANSIFCGDDTISGGANYDQIFGDANRLMASDFDTFQTEIGFSHNLIVAGDDIIDGGSGGDAIFGDSRRAWAQDYDNTVPIEADGSSLNEIYGGSDTIEGAEGNDTIYGDFTVSRATSYQDHEVAYIESGDDFIGGGSGDDWIYGDGLSAQAQDHGGTIASATILSGDDTIEGGAGNDNLVGDYLQVEVIGDAVFETGADVFVFNPGSGLDVIHDFETGQDRIDLTGYGVTDISELDITNEFVNGEWQAVIDLDGTAADVDEITLLGVDALSADDFILA